MNDCRFGLAYEMALRFAIDKADRLSLLSTDAYKWAALEDEEKVPVRIQPNMYSYT